MKELKNEESGKAFKIFAIEGIELGSEVEYYFIRKMSPSVFDRVFLQYDVPVKNNSFLLTCPEHLKFDFKTYHDFPEVKEEENSERNVYLTSMTDVPALKTEAFSNFDPNRKRVEFKLAYNTASRNPGCTHGTKLLKHSIPCLRRFQRMMKKHWINLLRHWETIHLKHLEERIKNIENKIKASIQVNKEGDAESLNEIASIVKVKIASIRG